AVEAGLAQVAVARQAAVGVSVQAGVGRQGDVVGDAAVFLVVAQQRQAGVFAGLPGEGRCDELALVVAVVDFALAVTQQAGQAVGEGTVVVQAVAEVEGALGAVVAAGL